MQLKPKSDSLLLYSFRRCPFAIRVRMVLAEKNIVYTLKEEDLNAPSSELLAIHSEGRVPVLVHDYLVLHESAIITEYLDDIFPTNKLLPNSPQLKAKIRLWTYWCDQIFKPDLDMLKYEFENFSEIQKHDLIEKCKIHLKTLSDSIEQNGYLLNHEFTLADVHLFPFYRQLQKTISKIPFKFQTKVLDEWLLKITSRPSFKTVMQKI